MIVCTIELWPLGDELQKESLGKVIIVNNGEGTLTHGDYNVIMLTRHNPPRVWRRGKIENFPRQRLGAYDLLLRALLCICKTRNLRAIKSDLKDYEDTEDVFKELADIALDL